MLDTQRIRAITLDLDDTLWPIRPTIERAERVLQQWLQAQAPATAALLAAAPTLMREIRASVVAQYPDRTHDLVMLRQATIAQALERAGDDPALAHEGLRVFMAERQRVDLFDDALQALEFLSARHPLVALSNGNADLQVIGIGRYFQAGISATHFGVAKPDPRIFWAAAELVQAAPEDVLHVGDDATTDAHGALGAGMQAVWLNAAGHDWPHERTPHATVDSLTALCQLLD